MFTDSKDEQISGGAVIKKRIGSVGEVSRKELVRFVPF
jgi:hypothetical protein